MLNKSCLNHFPRKIIKNCMQTNYSTKICKSKHYANKRLFEGGRCELSLALFKIGHLFLSIFAERCHFFSGLLLEKNIIKIIKIRVIFDDFVCQVLDVLKNNSH